MMYGNYNLSHNVTQQPDGTNNYKALVDFSVKNTGNYPLSDINLLLPLVDFDEYQESLLTNGSTNILQIMEETDGIFERQLLPGETVSFTLSFNAKDVTEIPVSLVSRFDLLGKTDFAPIEIQQEPKQVHFEVSFDSMGGTRIPSIDVLSGSKIVKPLDPVKDGYSFDGWYTDESFASLWNFEADTVIEDTTLYAKWEQTIQTKPVDPTNTVNPTTPQTGDTENTIPTLPNTGVSQVSFVLPLFVTLLGLSFVLVNVGTRVKED